MRPARARHLLDVSLRLYGPGEAWFDKSYPGDIELQP
jgi:hypothetical protein